MSEVETPRLTEEALQQMKARLDTATPGPWTAEWSSDFPDGHPEGGAKYVYAWQSRIEIAGDIEWGMVGPEDADFMAHARSDVPVLIAEVERLRGVVERLGSNEAFALSWNNNRAECAEYRAELRARMDFAREAIRDARVAS